MCASLDYVADSMAGSRLKGENYFLQELNILEEEGINGKDRVASF